MYKVLARITHNRAPAVPWRNVNFQTLTLAVLIKVFTARKISKNLKKLLDHVVLPRKGKLSLEDKQKEHSEEFIEARRKHSAIESTINALENHALDRCPDHGIYGFKRYVALAVLARNIQILGARVQQKKLKCLKRREKAGNTIRLAA